LIAEGLEVGLVISQQRIWRREHDVTALSELDAVFVVGAVAQTNDDFLSSGVGLVQTKNSRKFFPPLSAAFGMSR